MRCAIEIFHTGDASKSTDTPASFCAGDSAPGSRNATYLSDAGRNWYPNRGLSVFMCVPNREEDIVTLGSFFKHVRDLLWYFGGIANTLQVTKIVSGHAYHWVRQKEQVRTLYTVVSIIRPEASISEYALFHTTYPQLRKSNWNSPTFLRKQVTDQNE